MKKGGVYRPSHGHCMVLLITKKHSEAEINVSCKGMIKDYSNVEYIIGIYKHEFTNKEQGVSCL